jgi:hypothetical protein
MLITDVERRFAGLDDLMLGLVEILDSQVKVVLQRTSRIRPSRRLVVLHPLEREHEARAGVEREPVLVERPSGSGWLATPRSDWQNRASSRASEQSSTTDCGLAITSVLQGRLPSHAAGL